LLLLKRKTECLMIDTKKMLDKNNLPNGTSVIFDNLACEYRNFVSLLEGLEHACNS